MREPRDPRHPKASEIAESVVPGRILGCLAVAEKAGAEAAKRRVFLAISDGGIARITTGVITENRRRYLSRCSRRQFPARAARSGQSRCRSPKTSCARSRGVGFFPVLFPVVPPEFESRCFHGFPLMAISPITCLCSGVLIFAGLFGRAITRFPRRFRYGFRKPKTFKNAQISRVPSPGTVSCLFIEERPFSQAGSNRFGPRLSL